MNDQNKILDSVLLPLADIFESGKDHWLPIKQESPEEFEPLRQALAQLVAEGSLKQVGKNDMSYQLTSKGYLNYKSRIAALRALPR